MTKKQDKDSISQSLARLESIVQWLDDQEHVDVAEGLEKIREGAVLVKELRARLKEVENEFMEITKDLENTEEA